MHSSRSWFIIIALAIVLILLSLVHFIVYEGLVLAFLPLGIGANSYFFLILKILFVILTLSFIISSVLSAKYNNLFTRILYRLSASWTGFLLYLFFAAILYTLYLLIAPASTAFALILFGLALLTGIYGIVHANSIKTKSVTVHLPSSPKTWQDRKAVFVSDLHLGQVRGKRFAEKIYAEIKKINPDIIFIGGDMYDGVAVEERSVIQPFKKLIGAGIAPLGTYFVTGNHEEFADNSKYIRAIRDTGMRVLLDEKINIDGIEIIGVDYKTTNTAKRFKNVLGKIPLDLNKPSILLKHVPLHIDVAADKGISLQLSGHTHKAQVFPFSLLTPRLFKRFDYGLQKYKNLEVVTSSGVGTWGPPLRVGTDSEIIVLNFK